MLSASVWNLLDFWKGIERASIYLMMFLAIAMLFLPLVQTQEAEAVALSTVILVGTFGVAVVTLGITLYMLFCNRCRAAVGLSTHYAMCYGYHHGNGPNGFYSCQKSERWLHGACNN